MGQRQENNWVFPKIGVPPNHFNRVFHYKPSILGYPYFWKHQIVLGMLVWRPIFSEDPRATLASVLAVFWLNGILGIPVSCSCSLLHSSVSLACLSGFFLRTFLHGFKDFCDFQPKKFGGDMIQFDLRIFFLKMGGPTTNL